VKQNQDKFLEKRPSASASNGGKGGRMVTRKGSAKEDLSRVGVNRGSMTQKEKRGKRGNKVATLPI